MASKFPRHTEVRFRDTKKAGGITVRGIELQTDEEGFVTGPHDLAKDIEAHGFVPEETWFRALPKNEQFKLAREDEDYLRFLSHADVQAVKGGGNKQASKQV